MRKKLLLIMVLGLTLRSAAFAAFDDMRVGARAPGMANVYTGIAEGADSLFYNPAGLCSVKEPEMSVQFGESAKKPTDGSTFESGYLGFAQPFRAIPHSSLGLGYLNINEASLITERTLALGYGIQFDLHHFDIPGRWSAGFNFKQLHREYQRDQYANNAIGDNGMTTDQVDPLFGKYGNARDAYSFDFGGLYHYGPRESSSVGLMLMNINQPDMSLSKAGDKIPMTIKLGATTRPSWGLASLEIRQVNHLASETDRDLAIGLERVFKLGSTASLTARGGLAQGTRGYEEMTAGISLEFGQIRLDYGFSLPSGDFPDARSNHRFGFVYKFRGTFAAKESQEKTEPRAMDLPQAPPELTAPHPVLTSSEAAKAMMERDMISRRFAADLGQYFEKKTEGASLKELAENLQAIKANYLSLGMDLTLVNSELDSIMRFMLREEQAAPTAISTPTAAPVKPAVMEPIQPQQPARPEVITPLGKAIKAQPVTAHMKELDQRIGFYLSEALRYYRQAVARGITDQERVEILEAIIRKFGDEAVKEIGREYERIKKRL